MQLRGPRLHRKISEVDQTNARVYLLSSCAKILSLNVEGMSMAKCEYLATILTENNVDLLLLQETHITESAAPSRHTIQNYSLIDRLNHEQYGTMNFARNATVVEMLASEITPNFIHRSLVKIGELSVVNIYKPHSKVWATATLPSFQHPTTVIEDFNGHHHE